MTHSGEAPRWGVRLGIGGEWPQAGKWSGDGSGDGGAGAEAPLSLRVVGNRLRRLSRRMGESWSAFTKTVLSSV